MYYIGLDIGGTKCAAVIAEIDENVEIIDKIVFPTEGKTPEQVIDHFCGFIDEKTAAYQIGGIGISCGGF